VSVIVPALMEKQMGRNNTIKIQVTGNLTKDAEARVSATGTDMLFISIASNIYDFKKKARKPLFFRASMFGKGVMNIAEHLKKGTTVLLCGDFDQDISKTDKGTFTNNMVQNATVEILSSKGGQAEAGAINDGDSDSGLFDDM